MKASFFSKKGGRVYFRLSRFASGPAFLFFSISLLWPVTLLAPSLFSSHTVLEPKVFVSVCEDKCCFKGMLDNKFRGAIFHPLTRMKEPSSTKTEAVWTQMELHGQSSYVMYQGCFVWSKNGTLKLSSQLCFSHKDFAHFLQTFIRHWVANVTFWNSL